MKKKKAVCITLFILCAALIGVSVWQIYRQLHEYSEGADSYEELSEFIDLPEVPELPPDIISEESQYEETADPIQWPEVDFASLREINPDIVGWLYIEGTQINYPVVQGEDNQYYLKHLFSGEWNNSGCIFLDCRNAADFSDSHSIIYGHHMKNGAMFCDLDHYKQQEFYDAHPYALLVTPEVNYQIEFFAGYVASVADSAWELGFSTDAEFEDWLDLARERSCFTSDIVPAATDRILTLSTCSYEFENARFVLLGRIK